MNTKQATLKLVQFNSEPCGFPKPRVSPLPDRFRFPTSVESYSQLFQRKVPGQYRHFARGRYAMGEAYRLAGVGAEGALLAPAYHCISMLDPAVSLGAEIQLYPLKSDLAPDLEKLEILLANYGKTVRALLAVHFFGFPQDFGELRQWCEKQQIVLVEDCSHVLFTERFRAAGTGVYGRFAIASPYKFFPSADGGLLFSPEEQIFAGVITHSGGLARELRGAKHTIEKCRLSNAKSFDTDAIDKELEALGNKLVVEGGEQIAEYSRPSFFYISADKKTRALHSSRFVVRVSAIDEIISARRRNFERWANAVSGLPNCYAPFAKLPQSCVPYMFPLYIEQVNPHFYWLKHLGVPVWRWDEIAISDCAIAQDYRLHLLHLPCHQSLTDAELNWMIVTLQTILRYSAKGAK